MTWGYLDISFVNLKEENSQVLFSECDDDQLVLGGSSTRSDSETQPLSLFAGKEKKLVSSSSSSKTESDTDSQLQGISKKK